MQIAILKGTYATIDADYRTKYPRNLVPVPKVQGISNGFLRPSEGIEQLCEHTGADRGGINWNGSLYRVMGSDLIYVSATGAITVIGDVGTGGYVSFAYSFDRLAVTSGGRLYYYDGTDLTQVTDVDLGSALDVIWIDGYFMTTDGTSLVVTELNDPTAVDILKYGSAEMDPDSIKAIKKLSSEVYAVNRYTIEVYDNVGGTNFPFARIEGAAINRGAVGVKACCVFEDALAFLGGGKDEAPGLWLAGGGQNTKISTAEVDDILSEYTEAVLSNVVIEARIERNHRSLYIHLPRQTLVYDAASSTLLGMQVWYTLDSGIMAEKEYRARNFTYCYDKWISGDPTTMKLGTMTQSLSTHYGNHIRWDFYTSIMFNEARGFIIHELELTGLTGRTPIGLSPSIYRNYSTDGVTFSQSKGKKIGRRAHRKNRVLWTKCGQVDRQRIEHFHGTSQTHIGIARLDASIEGLNY